MQPERERGFLHTWKETKMKEMRWGRRVFALNFLRGVGVVSLIWRMKVVTR